MGANSARLWLRPALLGTKRFMPLGIFWAAALEIPDLDAIRVAAIANNAPVSYGALGVPIVALAAVTGLPLMQLSASIGHIVAILALAAALGADLPGPGGAGFREGWPLAIVGSLGYIAGQFPVAVYLGPYLPDIIGSIVCFVCLLLLLKVWRPNAGAGLWRRAGLGRGRGGGAGGAAVPAGEVFRAWLPFIVLIVVVVLWTGPWSSLPRDHPVQSLGRRAFVAHAGAVVQRDVQLRPVHRRHRDLASWIITRSCCGRAARSSRGVHPHLPPDVGRAAGRRVHLRARLRIQLFGHGGLARQRLLQHRVWFIVVAPILGWIGVALSGSNTSTNAMFGAFQAAVGKLLGFPLLLLPSLNSVGAEIGKPIAPQTASVGVSTSRFVRDEGQIIRHNMGWTLILLVYLIVIGLIYYFLAPGVMRLGG